MRNLFKIIFLLLLISLLFSDAVQLLRTILYYLNPSFQNRFLIERRDAFFHSPLWRYSFYFHIAVGSIILFSGLFSGILMLPVHWLKFGKLYFLKVHRLAGGLYVWTVLWIAAPSGFIMAFYTKAGWAIALNFIFLSCLWFWITLQGKRLASDGFFRDHGILMILSLGLACSAIVQRRIVYFWPLIEVIFNFQNPQSAYPFSAVSGWVSTLAVSLALVHFVFKKSFSEILLLMIPKRFNARASNAHAIIYHR